MAVTLDKYGTKPQRHVLPRPVEQAIQQRLGAVADHTSTAPEWTGWLEAAGDDGLLITVRFLDAVGPSRFSRGPRWWELEMGMSVTDFADLGHGPAVTLRFVETIEVALLKCHSGLKPAPPESLGRTKREIAWLAEGHADPGPGTDNPVRIAKPPAPMQEARFWDLISRTTANGTGAFRLGWQQANRFTSRMRLLVDALDDEAHLKATEEVLGFVSDDVWEDTRVWVVTLGEEKYEALLEDPALLKRQLDELHDQEAIGHAEALLYLTGAD